MRRTTTLTALALIGLAVPGLALLGPSAATGAAGTCQGRTATIVGDPGRAVVGTEDSDVILTHGATAVHALGGNDLVCVTGRRTVSVTVEAGSGDDVVDAHDGPGQPVLADLGTGTDTFLGGPGDDRVELAYPDNTSGIDVVRGGEGDDQLQLQTGPGAAVIDNAAGGFTSAGVLLAQWSDLEDFWVMTPPAPRHLTFEGSTARDRLVHDSWQPAVLDVDLGAGDDVVETRLPPLSGSRLEGGKGTDLVAIASEGSPLALDLALGRLGVRLPDPYDVDAAGFEDAEVFAPEVLLAGTRGDNRLGVMACAGVVTGRAGDDVLRRQYDATFETDLDCSDSLTFSGGQGSDRFRGHGGDDTISGGPGRDVINGRGGDDLVRGNGGADRIWGKGGDDTVYGGGGDDRIVGGPGRDRALGGQGRDRCDADVEKSCER
ncbi:hypothetical protein GCM10009641_60160 [Mycobacterium cookii]|uniref:Hemolysin-type calcium-binding repeat-containing protein n=1 Tax=Nocardioides furvisabuli TaxID=375542 RepID=A0ABP5IYH9_9ACTN|nr:calcium-binding protein [Nocardioides furvisabuli]